MKSTYKSLFEIIEESVERGRGGWDLDPAHPRLCRSYDERFRAGDKEIVLWEISRCIENKMPIPEWAGIAFRVALERVVTCESTWDEAFGKVPASGRYRKSLSETDFGLTFRPRSSGRPSLSPLALRRCAAKRRDTANENFNLRRPETSKGNFLFQGSNLATGLDPADTAGWRANLTIGSWPARLNAIALERREQWRPQKKTPPLVTTGLGKNF
jgi:hypothetical protein